MPSAEFGLLALVGAAFWGSLVVVARRLRRGQPVLERVARRSVPWNSMAVLGLFLLFVLLDGVVPLLLLGQNPVAIDTQTIEPNAATKLLIAPIVSRLMWSGLALGALALVDAKSTDIGCRCDMLGLDALIGAATAALLLPPLLALHALLTYALKYDYQHPLIDLVTSGQSPHLLALAGVSAVVAAPVAEEIMFRLILQGWLERNERKWQRLIRPIKLPRGLISIVISAILFGAIHAGQGTAPAPLALLGAALGYVYHRTHRVAPCIIAHALFNAYTVAAMTLAMRAS